jgi:hypothetical protein
MARQPMPKALSFLQSVQRSYTSEFSVGKRVLSWRLSELVSKKRKEGNLEFAGYDGCGIVIYSVSELASES